MDATVWFVSKELPIKNIFLPKTTNLIKCATSMQKSLPAWRSKGPIHPKQMILRGIIFSNIWQMWNDKTCSKSFQLNIFPNFLCFLSPPKKTPERPASFGDLQRGGKANGEPFSLRPNSCLGRFAQRVSPPRFLPTGPPPHLSASQRGKIRRRIQSMKPCHHLPGVFAPQFFSMVFVLCLFWQKK